MSGLLKLNSEESFEVLAVVHVVLQNVNCNFSSSLLISEFQSAVSMLVVFTSLSALTLVMEVDGLPFALDGAIRIVLTDNGDGALLLVDRVANVLGLVEAQASWLVVIEDRNFAFSVSADKSVAGDGVVKFDEEIFIGLPAFVIHDLDLDSFCLLLGSERDDPVYGFKIFRSNGGVIAGADTNSSSDSIFVADDHVGVIVGFRDRELHAAEAETVVFLALLEGAGVQVLLTVLAASLNDRFDSTVGVVVAVLKAGHNGLAFKNVLKLLQINVGNAGSAELLLEELAHLLRGGSLFGSSPHFTSLLRNEVAEDFKGCEWNWGDDSSTGKWRAVSNHVSGLRVLRIVGDFAVL